MRKPTPNSTEKSSSEGQKAADKILDLEPTKLYKVGNKYIYTSNGIEKYIPVHEKTEDPDDYLDKHKSKHAFKQEELIFDSTDNTWKLVNKSEVQ